MFRKLEIPAKAGRFINTVVVSLASNFILALAMLLITIFALLCSATGQDPWWVLRAIGASIEALIIGGIRYTGEVGDAVLYLFRQFGYPLNLSPLEAGWTVVKSVLVIFFLFVVVGVGASSNWSAADVIRARLRNK